MNKLRINVPNARYYKRIWLEVFNGGSDEWLWVVRDGLTYIFIRILDLPAHCGRDATEQWAADVSVVDLATISTNTMVGAVKSCGLEDDPPDFTTESGRLALAEACLMAGVKAPMWDATSGKVSNPYEQGNENGRAFLSLRRQAREAAEGLFDSEDRDLLLDETVVNKVGHTAREYMNGGDEWWDAIRRAKLPGATPEQQVIAKVYGKCERTLGGEMIPPDIRE